MTNGICGQILKHYWWTIDLLKEIISVVICVPDRWPAAVIRWLNTSSPCRPSRAGGLMLTTWILFYFGISINLMKFSLRECLADISVGDKSNFSVFCPSHRINSQGLRLLERNRRPKWCCQLGRYCRTRRFEAVGVTGAVEHVFVPNRPKSFFLGLEFRWLEYEAMRAREDRFRANAAFQRLSLCWGDQLLHAVGRDESSCVWSESRTPNLTKLLVHFA